MIEIVVFEGDTADWTFSLKRGGTAVDLAGATAALSVPFLSISASVMTVDGSADTASYSPSAADTDGNQCYHVPAFVVITFVSGDIETFPFVLTVQPRNFWERISPTTSTSTSTSSSTSTTTTL